MRCCITFKIKFWTMHIAGVHHQGHMAHIVLLIEIRFFGGSYGLRNSSDSDDELLLPQSPVGEVNARRGTVEINYRISSDMTDI